MAKVIGGQSLPNIPWEEKPAGCKEVMWRYSANPIIKRDATSISNSIFNSAVVPFGNGFAGVFRCDDKCIRMNIFVGFSDDGLNWNISDEPIQFEGDPDVTRFEYRYDPRVCKIEDKYFEEHIYLFKYGISIFGSFIFVNINPYNIFSS